MPGKYGHLGHPGFLMKHRLKWDSQFNYFRNKVKWMIKSPFLYCFGHLEYNLIKTRQRSLLCSKGREWTILFTEITHHTVMLYQLHATKLFASIKKKEKKSLSGTVQATTSSNIVIIILNNVVIYNIELKSSLWNGLMWWITEKEKSDQEIRKKMKKEITYC